MSPGRGCGPCGTMDSALVVMGARGVTASADLTAPSTHTCFLSRGAILKNPRRKALQWVELFFGVDIRP